MYPGDDVVDLWGVHYYDSGPEKNTQALWDQYYRSRSTAARGGSAPGSPRRQQHGKKLAVGEWGVWQQGGPDGGAADDPVYIDNMYRFFRANAADIAYESYFNATGQTPCTRPARRTAFPNAAATYKADWGR